MNDVHLANLAARHAQLEASLSAERQRPMPDQTTLSRLKREKLKLKEEMARPH